MSQKFYQKNTEKDIDFIPLSEAAKLSGYTPEYLNHLSRKKILKAEKIGRNWYTKKEWLNKMIAERTGKDISDDGVVKMDWEEKDFFEASANAVRIMLETEKEKSDQAKEDEEKKSEKEKIEYDKYFIREKKSNWKKTFSVLVAGMALAPMIIVGTYFIRTSSMVYSTQLNAVKNFFEKNNIDSGIINENDEIGIVKGEETGSDGSNMIIGDGVVLASENFTARQISLGGDVMLLANDNAVPFEITDIKSESFIASKKDEVKLVLSWKTNQMAISEVSYSKNNGQSAKTVKESSYGFTHNAVISELEQRTSYVYSIKARDRFGNAVESNYFGIFTTSKPVSVFDLISKAMGDVFGWAVKK
jgi:hypothetical protein